VIKGDPSCLAEVQCSLATRKIESTIRCFICIVTLIMNVGGLLISGYKSKDAGLQRSGCSGREIFLILDLLVRNIYC
jgi:hypothetical protein